MVQNSKQTPESERIRIALVEDDEDDYLIVHNLLNLASSNEFELEWIANYDGALKAIKADKFDIFLIDYRLGSQDGLSLAKLAIAHNDRVPVILLTGQSSQGLDISAMEAGVSDFLEKGSFDGVLLVRSIRYAIAQQQAHFALKESQQLNEGILNSLDAHVVVLDKDGTIIAANDSWKQFTAENTTDEGTIHPEGLNYFKVSRYATGSIGEQDAKAANAGIRAVMAGKQPVFTYEYPCHSPTGQCWFVMVVTPMRGKSGGVVIDHYNITERKLAEQSLKSSEARMQHLVASSPAVIYSADPTGEGKALTFVSDNVLQQLGYPSTVFVQEASFWETHVHPDDRARAVIGIGKTVDEKSHCQEYRLQNKDGSYRWIYDDSKLLEKADGQQEIVGSWLDITERKQAELDLAKKNAALSVLSASNAAIVHAGSEFDLLTELCSIIVNKGAYHMAWVGYCDWEDAAKAIQPIAQAGMGAEHLQTRSLTWADTEEGQHPSAAAIRTGKMQLVTDLSSDERFPALRSQAIEVGFSSIIALPLKSNEHCTGVLCIYSWETNAFDSDSARLLTELAQDVSFGVTALRTRTERERLRRHNELILNAVGEGIMGIDTKGMITSINPAGANILGWQKQALIGRSLTGEVCIFTDGTLKDSPDDRRPCPFDENHDIHAALYEGATQRSALNYFTKQDGSQVPVEYIVTPVEEEGKITGVVVDFNDIADRIEAEQALRASEERYALATKGANDGMWDWDLVKDEIYLSPRFHEILGYTEGGIGNHPEDVFKLVVGEDLIDLRTAITRHLDGLTDHLSHEFRMKHKDGSERWLLCRGVAVRDDKGKPYRMAGSQTEITESKLAEEQLIHDAFHDGLTNLPNRALLFDRLNLALKLGQRAEKLDFAIMFADLDNFKVINDSLGHLLGDRLLVEVSKRLMECIRPGDTATRLGGDEFVALLEGVKDAAEASIIAERFLDKVSLPLELDGHEVFPNASIGIAMANKDYRRSDEILRDADTAMYKAKSLGKGRYEVFNVEMHEGAMKRLHMENDLRRALERNEFKLNYQPIVRLDTAKPVGFEALLRWIHPERGFIPPLDFIPVAEETGQIVAIGEWVISEACRQLQAWQTEHAVYNDLYISVNLSPRQFSHPGLLSHIKQAIESAGLAAHHLRAEVTESAIMEDAEQAKQILNELHQMGVQIYMDDFGTGYSSLSYLHEFPIDVLKIDRSFVISYEKETKVANILKSVITLSRAINLKIVAEGIEEAHNADWLMSMGCDYGQGYYFSKPLPADQAADYISNELIVTATGPSKVADVPHRAV